MISLPGEQNLGTSVRRHLWSSVAVSGTVVALPHVGMPTGAKNRLVTFRALSLCRLFLFHI
jgi:hypothetical protein